MSPKVTLRSARVEDAPILCAAEAETARVPGRLVSHPHELKVESFALKIAELQDKGRYIVAEREGRPVGHAVLEPMSLKRLAHVQRLTMVVHPGFERQGIGAALMKDLIDWASANPAVGKIELLVRASNEGAIALYRKFGFVEEGRLLKRLKFEDGTYLDDVAMGWFPKKS
ncbi:MAG TPA: GNAT family N-acetyltransferase [Planctomycetota bacterium]|nr:GNAT family N-acetyltransferase [Planctomycetota bacterium]